jgi:GT2 family glycosyltransferase
MKLSLVVPLMNEEENIKPLFERVRESLEGIDYEFILVDDGSTDYTSSLVNSKFPMVNVIETPGGLFWNKGMHLAFQEALKKNYDAFLLLNDDTLLYSDAMQNLINTYKNLTHNDKGECIVVGSTINYKNITSYGGLIRPNAKRRFHFEILEPSDKPQACLTMNGNCVLIPASIAKTVGNLDPTFAHAMGDIDYGLRAQKLHFKIYIAPGHIGTCENNPTDGTFNDNNLSALHRFKLLISTKSLPFKSWATLTFRHGGLKAPLYFLWPYIKVWFK